MTGTAKVQLFSSPRGSRRERWQTVRDLLGGALLLAVWLALWTVTWAAVAGPLSPLGPAGRAAAGEVSRAWAG